MAGGPLMKWVLFLALLQAAAAFSIAPLHQPYAHAVRRALSPGLCFRWVHRELLVWLAKMDETDFDAVYQQQPLEARHCQAVQRCCWQERKSRGRGLQRSLCRRRRRWVSAMCVVMHSMLLATRLYLTHEQRAAKTATLVYAVLIGGGGVFAGIKSGSKPSIISSTIAAALLAYSYVAASTVLALGTSAALTVVFAIRFVKTKKMMPAGFLGTLSALFAALFALSLR